MLRLSSNRMCIIRSASVFLVTLWVIFLASCPQEKKEPPAPKARPTKSVQSVQKKAPQIDIHNAIAVIETAQGMMEVEFYPDDASLTVKNFIKNSRLGYYNGRSFHTDNPGETIQAGSPLVADTIPLEKNDQLHVKGAIAMAGDGVAESHASEFYICLTELEPVGQYAVFGKVVKGLDVLDELKPGDKITKINIREKS
jgi:peptidyl-prolyl cis-trans isomerase B (cyclophilin B)